MLSQGKLFRILCILLLAAAGPVFCQLDRGTITGVVTDPSGAVIADAKITVVNTDTNASLATSTTASGDYTLPAVRLGQYRVEVEAAGFKRGIRDNVVVSAGSTVRLDVSLEIGSATDSIEVGAIATPLDTDTTRIATNITNRLVDQLPLVVAGQMRNVFNLTNLAPEAKTTSSGYYRIGGGQQAGWDMLMDGMSITVASGTKQVGRAQITAVPIDAINEFTVESTGLKAEYGRAAGIINFATKTGTEQFHGNAFEYMRNDALDARGFFAASRPRYNQHDFGATLGGPFWIPKVYDGKKHKTFFFLSYEGFRSRQGAAPAYYTIPLPAMYQGDFSGWTNKSGQMIPIYDPASTRPNPSGSGYIRDPFPSNQIPVNRFSQVASNFIALRPAVMVTNIAGPNLNYFYQHGSMTYPWDKGTARMDHQLTSKDGIMFFFMKGENADTAGPDGVPGLPYPYETGPTQWTRKMTYARASWDRMISPHTVNTVRYSKMKGYGFGYSVPCADWGQDWGAKLGVKNVPGPDRCMPPMTFTNAYTSWDNTTDDSWGQDDAWNWTASEDLTHIRGSHTIKGGFYYSRDDWAGGGQFIPNGSYGFSQLATAIPGDQSQNSGNAFASMLLGYTNSAGLETPRREIFHWKHLGAYLQDDWRVSPKLTMNVGVRYDFTFALTGGAFTAVFSGPSDTIGTGVANLEPGFSNFSPTTPNPGAGGIPGAIIFTGTGAGRTGKVTPFDTWPWAIQPRLGLAYSIKPGTVLRASAGRTFEDIKTQGGTTHFDGFIGTLSWTSADLDVNDFPMKLDAGLPAWQQPPYLKPDVLNGLATNYWQPDTAGRPAEYWNWNFDIQKQIASTTVLTVRYSGSKGTHLTSGLLNLNQISPNYLTEYGQTLLTSNINSPAAVAAGIKSPYPGFNNTVQMALQPYPQYKNIAVGLEHVGNSTYNAMIVTVDRRFSSGLTMLASYALSKIFTDADSMTGGTAAMDLFDQKLEKGLSADDQTHVIRASVTYDLPVGQGKRFLSKGIASRVLGGWTLSGNVEYSSGTPLTVAPGITLAYGGTDRVFITSYDNWRAMTAGSSFDPFQDSWWTKSAFNQQPSSVLNSVLGNATRDNPKARSPWFENENVSLGKSIPLREHVRLTLRFEGFNLFNRVQWGAPDSTLNSTTFGLVRTQANTPRQMQVAAKLNF
jgi:outer membrane receptor protein involved in Fe transport